MTWKGTTYRIFGNAGTFFITPYVGSVIQGVPSIEIAAWSAVVGILMSASREITELGKKIK